MLSFGRLRGPLGSESCLHQAPGGSRRANNCWSSSAGARRETQPNREAMESSRFLFGRDEITVCECVCVLVRTERRSSCAGFRRRGNRFSGRAGASLRHPEELRLVNSHNRREEGVNKCCAAFHGFPLSRIPYGVEARSSSAVSGAEVPDVPAVTDYSKTERKQKIFSVQD